MSKAKSTGGSAGLGADGVGNEGSVRSMGKKTRTRDGALDDSAVSAAVGAATGATVGARSVVLDELPKISSVAGSALQADIMDLNRAVIRLLQTAARLGHAEPLAPLLLDTTPEMIDIFLQPGRGERLLAQSIGFPLVQLRIRDVGVMRQMLSDGLVSSQSVQALTKTFPLPVIEASNRARGV